MGGEGVFGFGHLADVAVDEDEVGAVAVGEHGGFAVGAAGGGPGHGGAVAVGVVLVEHHAARDFHVIDSHAFSVEVGGIPGAGEEVVDSVMGFPEVPVGRVVDARGALEHLAAAGLHQIGNVHVNSDPLRPGAEVGAVLGEQVVVVLRVEHRRGVELAEVGLAMGGARFFANRADDGNEDRGENSDDRDYREEFNEGKGAAGNSVLGHDRKKTRTAEVYRFFRCPRL